MPQIGKINVSLQELSDIANECESCCNDLRTYLTNCHNQVDGLLADGWESDSGDKLADEFVNMANANFDNYLYALEGYANFCVDTYNEYEKLEIDTNQQIRTAANLQDIS